MLMLMQNQWPARHCSCIRHCMHKRSTKVCLKRLTWQADTCNRYAIAAVLSMCHSAQQLFASTWISNAPRFQQPSETLWEVGHLRKDICVSQDCPARNEACREPSGFLTRNILNVSANRLSYCVAYWQVILFQGKLVQLHAICAEHQPLHSN